MPFASIRHWSDIKISYESPLCTVRAIYFQFVRPVCVDKTCIASGLGTLNWVILVRMHPERTQKDVKEVPVREFIDSVLRLHNTQSTFRVWYNFPMAQEIGRLVHTRYSGLVFGVSLLLDGLSLQWLRSLHLPRASWPLTP